MKMQASTLHRMPSPHGGSACRRSRRGFTLIELVVIVAIIAVLAAIAALALDNYPDRAREAVLRQNAESLYLELAAIAQDYDAGHLYAASDSDPASDPAVQTILSRYMEALCEQRMAGGDNNGFVNPESHSARVVCGSVFPLSGSDVQPAVLFSDNADLRYESGLDPATAAASLRGCLVVSIANGRDSADIYYVNEAGIKSGTRYRLQGFAGG